MSSARLAAASRPAPLSDDATTYIRRVSQLLADALAQGVAALAEPAAADRRRAYKLVAPLVDTLEGFALGSVADHIALAVRRANGFAAAAAVKAAIAREWRIPPVPGEVAPIRYLADAHLRPLVDELATRLHTRLCLAAPALGALVSIAASEIARAAAGEPLARVLSAREDDALIVDRIAGEIAIGWSIYSALTSAAPAPGAEGRSARSLALWTAWSARLSGRRAVLVPTTAEPDGVILTIR